MKHRKLCPVTTNNASVCLCEDISTEPRPSPTDTPETFVRMGTTDENGVLTIKGPLLKTQKIILQKEGYKDKIMSAEEFVKSKEIYMTPTPPPAPLSEATGTEDAKGWKEEVNQVMSNGVRLYVATDGERILFRARKPGFKHFEVTDKLEIDIAYYYRGIVPSEPIPEEWEEECNDCRNSTGMICNFHLRKIDDRSSELLRGINPKEVEQIQEEWAKDIAELIGKNFKYKGVNTKGIIIYIRSLLSQAKAEGRKEERQAWLYHKRCHSCGKDMQGEKLSNMCGKCLETA